MMDRLAPTLVLVLLLACLGELFLLKSAWDNLTEARAAAGQFQRANESLAQTVGLLDLERKDQAAQALAALERADAGNRTLAATRDQLKRLKARHETLRAYLDSRIPRGVEQLLWPLTRADPSDPHPASGDPAEGDAEAPGAVTHERGWEWCKVLDIAIDNCNADKAQLRAWRDRHGHGIP